MKMRKAPEEKLAASAAERKIAAMQKTLKEREEELKKLRHDLEKPRHQNKDGKKGE
jgi:hypothetical protein